MVYVQTLAFSFSFGSAKRLSESHKKVKSPTVFYMLWMPHFVSDGNVLHQRDIVLFAALLLPLLSLWYYHKYQWLVNSIWVVYMHCTWLINYSYCVLLGWRSFCHVVYNTAENHTVHLNMLLIWSAMHSTFILTARFAVLAYFPSIRASQPEMARSYAM